MAKYQLLLPKMGESVAEATIIKWVKSPGDYIEADDAVIEIATDKVDSEVPSPVSGRLVEQLCKEDDIVQVGAVVAIIETDDEEEDASVNASPEPTSESTPPPVIEEQKKDIFFTPPTIQSQQEQPALIADSTGIESQQSGENISAQESQPEGIPGTDLLDKAQTSAQPQRSVSDAPRFYSPLVKHIAFQEKISMAELDSIKGSGSDGRLTKDDLLNYLRNRGGKATSAQTQPATSGQPAEIKGQGAEKENIKAHKVQTETPSWLRETGTPVAEAAKENAPAVAEKEQSASTPIQPANGSSVSGADEIIEMDRMRRLIAEHMVMSKHTSPHVTSFVEADVTGLVLWRERIKSSFEKREGEKITFTPIFMEAVVKAIRDFPLINSSVNGTQIIKKAAINISMATALPNGNLIVPVIKKADELNLIGLTKAVNGLATKARMNKLQPDDVKDGTFTITNVGTFGNLMGTPIINQPQVAILAIGAIKKKPAVMETPEGDVIAIRHMMFLSLSYDHRVVDGALGGSFVKRIADYLENWDTSREV
jgi:2-oxoglutarate dehydrogenase E2 component (dihydrolipoamide succinyltransferase)